MLAALKKSEANGKTGKASNGRGKKRSAGDDSGAPKAKRKKKEVRAPAWGCEEVG